MRLASEPFEHPATEFVGNELGANTFDYGYVKQE
jgi:hypothetical protein